MSNNNDMNNMNSNRDSPSDPASRLSSKARLGYFLTGGTKRSPSSMTSFLKMARDRADAGKGSKAWDAARKKECEKEADVSGPKPKGRALVRWYRRNRGELQDAGRRVISPDRLAPPMQELQESQQQRQQQQQQQKDTDIRGVSDEGRGQRDHEGYGTGDGQNEAGSEAEPHQPSGDIGDGDPRQSPDTPAEQQGND